MGNSRFREKDVSPFTSSQWYTESWPLNSTVLTDVSAATALSRANDGPVATSWVASHKLIINPDAADAGRFANLLQTGHRDDVELRLDQIRLLARAGDGERARLAARGFLDENPGHSRGLGIGTRLLENLFDHGRELGFERVRLDVASTNPSARRLYERIGFVPVRTSEHRLLAKRLGFSASTEMLFDL